MRTVNRIFVLNDSLPVQEMIKSDYPTSPEPSQTGLLAEVNKSWLVFLSHIIVSSLPINTMIHYCLFKILLKSILSPIWT